MADDPNAKPPLLPKIIEETNWPHFLRHPVDPGERARRAQQAADEQVQQSADEQRERELEQRERLHTANGRKANAARQQRRKEIFIKAAETVVLPGTSKKMAWRDAGAALEQANKLLERDGFKKLLTRDPIYHAICVPHVWARLTSLRKR